MLAVRLISKRRNRLRPVALFAFPCCRTATGFVRTYSDGGPVIATKEAGGTKTKQKKPKTVESIVDGAKPNKKPRKPRSDAGTSRGSNNNGGPPKPRAPSTKPRKKRSDAGVLKGPMLKRAFEDVLHGARLAIPEGQAETDGKGQRPYTAGRGTDSFDVVPKIRQPPSNLSRIAFGKRGDKARQNIIGRELCGMDVILNLWSTS
jgi:hypothetical protein